MNIAVIMDVITILVSIIFIVRNFKNFTWSARYIIYFLFVMFYIVPLFLDYFYMMPDYTRSSRYIGYLISQKDLVTRIIYDLFLVYSQCIILKSGRRHNENSLMISEQERNEHKGLLMFFLLLPIILAFIFPVNKGILVSFQWREIGLYPYSKYIAILEKLSYIGICCGVMLIISKRNNFFLKAIATIAVISNMCIEGKRAIVFFAVVVVIIALIPGLNDPMISMHERRKRLIRLGIFASIAIVFMILISISVKINDRGYLPEQTAYMYTTLRIDFLRDDRVRLAIYSLLHPEEIHILDYPGQTILPILSWAFPIDYILGSFGINFPSYTAYLSAGLEKTSLATSYNFMTPCMVAEMTSNLGFIGLLLFPFICLIFARIADNNLFPMNVLTIVVFVALQLFATAYVMYLIEFVLLMFLFTKKRVTIESYVL